MKKIFCVLLATLLPLAASADKFTLVKKGTILKPTEDMHCINNDGAKKLISKIKLCNEECEVRLQTQQELHDADMLAALDKLKLERQLRKDVVREKDRSFSEMERAYQRQLEKATSNGVWWKVTLGVTGGVVVGALIGALAVQYGK